jgi:hypothetical protein
MGDVKNKREDDLLDTFCYGIAIALGDDKGFCMENSAIKGQQRGTNVGGGWRQQKANAVPPSNATSLRPRLIGRCTSTLGVLPFAYFSRASKTTKGDATKLQIPSVGDDD